MNYIITNTIKIRNMKKLLLIAILLLGGYSYGQYITVGVSIRTIHFKKLNVNGKKYQNWNFGVTAGYTHSNNFSTELALVRNSYNKPSVVGAIGYKLGDFEAQIGGATGYSSVGGGLVRPGYFINYHRDNVRIRLNHSIINFGLYNNFKLNN